MIKKINKYQLLELICIFIITLFFNLVCVSMNQDEIWNYGFAYNIANGLIPYKDFNMVVTPFFPILSAIIMKIIGDSILTLHLINSVICTLIFKYMKKSYPKCYYIPYSIFLFYSLPNYNLLCLLFLYILLDLEKNNRNDYLIGLIIGMTFITKQNVGVYLLIPSILLNIKNTKKVIKRLIVFSIPIILLLAYLILNNALYNFIDYCFLGMKEFASKNLDINYVYLTFLLTGIAYSIIAFIKTKERKYLYLIFYNLIAFPIIEDYHVMLAFIPIFGFFLSNLNLNKKIISYTFIAFITIVFAFNIYNIYINKYNYPNETDTYKYRKLYPADANSIAQVSKYTQSIDDKLYLIISTAYLIRLENKMPTNKYDLLNNGNLGLNGETKLINEIDNTCKEKKCTFIIDITDTIKPEATQFNQAIVKHIIENYNEYGNIYDYELKIYKNY